MMLVYPGMSNKPVDGKSLMLNAYGYPKKKHPCTVQVGKPTIIVHHLCLFPYLVGCVNQLTFLSFYHDWLYI